jgi:hypothetical protein
LSPPKHLLVALTSHGYGHAAQTADTINALRAAYPNVRITFWTRLPVNFLLARFFGDFALEARTTDVGMLMASAIDVRRDDSARAYVEFHRGWERSVDDEARALVRLAPDLVLANVPYRVLAGAARAGIPALAMCSLNWAGIYWHYFRDRPEAPAIHGQMLAAYRSAAAFLQVEPGMDMPDLPNRRRVGCCARIGRNRRPELNERLGLGPGSRLVLIAPGGMELRLPIETWPAMPGVHFLVPASWQVQAPAVTAIENLGVPFTDLLRSSDAVIGKPGYGTFAEAACNATPMLFVPRADWPEAPALVDWLERHGQCAEIASSRLYQGDIHDPLEQLWSQPKTAPVEPTGVAESAAILANYLDLTGSTEL